MSEKKDNCKALQDGYKRYLQGLEGEIKQTKLDTMNVERLLHSTFGFSKLLNEYHICSKDESVFPMVSAGNRMMEDVLRLVTTKIGYDKLKDIRTSVTKAMQALQAVDKSVESATQATSFESYKKKILENLNKIK